jgi:hypothetical protein
MMHTSSVSCIHTDQFSVIPMEEERELTGEQAQAQESSATDFVFQRRATFSSVV